MYFTQPPFYFAVLMLLMKLCLLLKLGNHEDYMMGHRARFFYLTLFNRHSVTFFMKFYKCQ